MKPTKFALNRPVTVLMVFSAVVLIGIISLQRLSLELLPKMNYPQITILTSYENVSSSEIESLISKPIEEGVGTVKGVKRITSLSKEGVSLVTLDFEWGVDTNLSALDVREKVDLIKDSLPKEAGNPIIVKFDPSSLPVITLGISGQSGLAELTRIASDKIKQKLERIQGVALARISGAVEREIQVSVDQGRLFAYGIPISNVVERLKNANFNFPGGKIENAKGVIRIRTIGQFGNLKDFEKVVVAKGRGKAPIFLRDVATIKDSFKEQKSSFMIGGKRSIGISIFKQADSNTVKVADSILREVEQLKRELIPEVNIVVVYNQAQFIKDSITDLKWAGLLGGTLAFLVLFLFLHSFRSALIITTAIPISVLGSFALMYMTGITLNIMSLGGLALAVGLLVDNGIVILENIHRHKKDIPTLYEAVIVGAEEMHNPVIASTLAHIIVFLPIIFVKGLAGNFFTQLAFTISFSLLMSILVALMLNPILEARRITFRQVSTDPHRSFALSSASSHDRVWTSKVIYLMLNPLWRFIDIVMKATEKFYLRVLLLSLKNRNKVLMVTMLILAISISLLPNMERKFIPDVDQGSFILKVTTPPGTTLNTTENVASKIEKILSAEPEVKKVFINIGYDEKEKAEKAFGEAEINVAKLTVILVDERERSVRELVDTVRPKIFKIPESKVEYILNQDVTQLLRQREKAPEILEIKGPELETIKRLTNEFKNKLKEIKELKDIKSNIGEDEPEIQISVDREKAASFKLTVNDIADTIKTCMEGEVATLYHDADQDVDIRVRLKDEYRRNLPNLEKILIHTPLNNNIPLKEVARISLGKNLRQIERRDLNRISVISANISGVNFSECQKEIKNAIGEISIPAHHFISISNEQEELNRSFRSLTFALILAIILVYMLLASLFESFVYPFIIMFAVPLAAVGVILILFLTDTSISLGVYIGGIMLGGIVVNNSIILVDYMNRLKKKGISREKVVVEGGRVRLRPILMTAVTTILGLIPLAIGLGKGAEIRSPLAITVIGGLATSTLMTLIVIPVVYSLVEDIKKIIFKPES